MADILSQEEIEQLLGVIEEDFTVKELVESYIKYSYKEVKQDTQELEHKLDKLNAEYMQSKSLQNFMENVKDFIKEYEKERSKRVELEEYLASKDIVYKYKNEQE